MNAFWSSNGHLTSFHRPAIEAGGNLWGGGIADIITPVIHDTTGEVWTGMHADTPQGRIEYLSPLRTFAKMGKVADRDWYGVAVMDHVVDFALAVRGLRRSEFTDEDALMSDMMEIGAHESVLQEGQKRFPFSNHNGNVQCFLPDRFGYEVGALWNRAFHFPSETRRTLYLFVNSYTR